MRATTLELCMVESTLLERKIVQSSKAMQCHPKAELFLLSFMAEAIVFVPFNAPRAYSHPLEAIAKCF